MTRPSLVLWLCPCLALTAADSSDLIRFTNGDQLHGSFVGIKTGPLATWQREDVSAPVDFQISRVRHVVLHGGQPSRPLESLAHLGLVNGDRMPGIVTGIDEHTVTLTTTYAGVLRIPRNQISMLAPNPLGGRVYYYGPFSEKDWSMAHASFPEGLPPPDANAMADAKAGPPNDEKSEVSASSSPGRWVFSGSAWYWKDKHTGTALIRESGLPDRAVLRFDLSWKNRLCLAIGFHADFAHTKPKDPDTPKGGKARGFIPGDASDLPRLFGNSYVLQLYSNYIMLYRTSVTADGKPSIEPIHQNNNLRLVESGESQVELRTNRLTGSITLFINDEFITQWSENDGSGRDGVHYAGKGSGFGFLVQGDDAPVRISDVVISEWNGMPDSARSLQVDDQDVVLMSNGTDRFAGHIGNLNQQGKIQFQGKHGPLHFPLEDVAEIRFAHNHLATPPDVSPDHLVVRFHPVGSVSGRPLPSDRSSFSILNSSAGELNLSLDSAVMIDFNASKQIIDDWDANF